MTTLTINTGSDGSYGLSLQRREKGDQREVTVLGVDAGSVNEGIALPGDEILTIGGVNVRGNHRLVMEQLVANKGKPVKVEVLRRPDVAAAAASSTKAISSTPSTSTAAAPAPAADKPVKPKPQATPLAPAPPPAAEDPDAHLQPGGQTMHTKGMARGMQVGKAPGEEAREVEVPLMSPEIALQNRLMAQAEAAEEAGTLERVVTPQQQPQQPAAGAEVVASEEEQLAWAMRESMAATTPEQPPPEVEVDPDAHHSRAGRRCIPKGWRHLIKQLLLLPPRRCLHRRRRGRLRKSILSATSCWWKGAIGADPSVLSSRMMRHRSYTR